MDDWEKVKNQFIFNQVIKDTPGTNVNNTLLDALLLNKLREYNKNKKKDKKKKKD